MHPTHKARFSDSSLYDEVCVHCNLNATITCDALRFYADDLHDWETNLTR